MGTRKFHPENAEFLGRDCVTCGKHLYDGRSGWDYFDSHVQLSGRKPGARDHMTSPLLRQIEEAAKREEEERKRNVDVFHKTHAMCVDSIATEIMNCRLIGVGVPYSPQMHTCGQCLDCYRNDNS